MNHIYKSIFNKALGVFTAVPEFASAHGKGSERTVVGRVAKGTAGFAASALAISVGLALTSTSAVAAPGIFINNGQDPACLAVIDDVATSALQLIYGGSKTIYPAVGVAAGSPLGTKTNFELDARNPCLSTGGTGAENHNTQTNRTLFYNNKNLTLGGRLDVNSGIIGVGDRGTDGVGATNSIRMGTGTTLDEANKKTNAISIGVDAGASADNAIAMGKSASAAGQRTIAMGENALAGNEASMALGYNSSAKGLAQVSIGQGAGTLKNTTDSGAADATFIGNYAGADSASPIGNMRGIAVGTNAGRNLVSGVHNIAVGYDAGKSIEGSNNVAIGYNTGSNVNGDLNFAGGREAGNSVKGEKNIALGYISGQNIEGNDNTTVGYSSGNNVTGWGNFAGASKAGQFVEGYNNVAIGYQAGMGTADNLLKTSGGVSISTNSKAKTSFSIAIGDSSSAGDDSTGAHGGGRLAIAIGQNANANFYHAIALGHSSRVSPATGQSAEDGIAIGSGALVDNYKGIAVGAYSRAKGRQSTVIANNVRDSNYSTASGDRSQVYGAETTVSGNNSVAIGDTNTVASARTYAIGNNINAAVGTDDSLAFGTKAAVGGNNAIAMGNTATASASGSVAISNQSKAKTTYSIALGERAVAGDDSTGALNNGEAAIAIGREASANVYNGIALGKQATVKKDSSDGIAIGSETKVNAYKGTAIGAFSEANGSQALAIGNNKQGQSSVASGERSQVIGVESNVSGQDSTAIGYKNTVASDRTYAIGNNINAAAGTPDSLAFGTRASVGGASSIALGSNTKTYTDDSISIGSFSESGGPATTGNLLGTKAIAIGYETKALATSAVALGYGATVENGHDSIAIGVKAKTSTQKSTTIGSYSEARGDQSTVIANNYDSKAGKAVSIASGARSQVYGAETTVSGNNSVAIGDTNTVAGARTYAIGNNINVAAGVDDALAFGTKAAVGGANAIALGNTASAAINNAIAVGQASSSTGNSAIAIGTKASAQGDSALAHGVEAQAIAQSSTAIGFRAKAQGYEQISIGSNAGNSSPANAENYGAVFIGRHAGSGNNSATGNTDGVSIGSNAGQNAVSGIKNVAIGPTTGQYVEGSQNLALSTNAGNSVKGDNNLAMMVGAGNNIEGGNNIAIGTNANSGTPTAKRVVTNSIAMGANTQATSNNTIAIGPQARALAADAVALGLGSLSNHANSVALGAGSVTSAAHTGDYTLNTSYTAAGQPVAANGTVSVGSAGKERQIQNVAAGVISATSTDAINGSQLYATNNYMNNFAGGVKNVLGGDAAVDNAGNLTMSNIGGTGKGNVHEAIAAVKGVADTAVQEVESENPTALSVKKDGTKVTLTPNFITGDLVNADGTVNAPATADEGKLVSAKTVADALKANHFVVDTKGNTETGSEADAKVGSGNKVTFEAGNNLVAKQANTANGGATVKFSLKDDISLNSVTAGTGANQVVLGNDGVKVGGNTYINNDGLNANSKVISNVADGVNPNDAVNKSQLDAVKGVADSAVKSVDTVASEENLVVDNNDPQNPKLRLKKAVNLTSIKLDGATPGNTTYVSGYGLTIEDGPSVKKAGINAGDKKITGVADGNVAAGSTDAVNGGQLAAVKAKADSAVQDVKSGDENALTAVKDPSTNIVTVTPKLSGDLVDANGNITAPTTPADKGKLVTAGTVAEALANTHFVVDTKATDGELDAASQADQKIKASNKVTLQAGKNLKAKQTNGANGAEVEFSLKDSISLKEVKVGEGSANEVVLNNNGVNVAGNTYINKDGLNANGNKVANVKAGDVSATSKDAVNGGQLHNVATSVANVLGGNAAVDGNGNVTSSDIGGTGANTVDDAIKAVNATAAKHTTVVEGKNVKVTKGKNAAGGDEYTVATKDDLDVTSVTAGNTTVNTNGLTITGGPSVTRGGIDAGNRVISGVKAGDVSATSQEAVNGSQLHATNTKLDGVKAKADTAVQDVKSGDENALTAVKDPNTNIVTVTPKLSGDLVDANGNITAPTTPADKGKLVTAGTVADALANTHFVVDTKATDGELDAASQADQKIKAGNKVTLQAGKNLKAKQTNGANGAQVEFSLKDSISLKEVTAGEGANQVVLGNDGVKVGGNTYINNAGLNANGNKITNVADGVDPTDAVNKSQLDAVKGVADSAVKSVDVANGEQNLVVDNTDPKNPKLSLKKDLTLDSVTAGDSTLNTDGLTITGGPSVKKDGINAGDKKIANVAAGDVSATSKDAVNGGQLYNVANNVKDLIGPDATIDPATGKVTVTDPAKGIGETGKDNIGDAIKHVNDAAKAAADTAKKHTTVEQGDNIVVEESTNADGGKHYKVSTAKNLNVDSVKAGDTTVNNDGVTIAGGPSVTKGGINAGGNTITNVADGVNSNDAVNKGQLDAVKNVADSAVKSVDVANGEQNLVVDNSDPKNPKLSLKKDLTVDSVTAGDSTLNNDGLTIAGGPSVKKDGIDAADKKITNVAAGDVAENSKDAVNGGQLYDVAKNVADLVGPDAKIDPATGKVTVTDPAKGIGETGKGNIGDAIKHVNDAAKAAADTAKKHTTVEQGDNIVVEESTNANGGKHYKVSTAKNLNVDSVKAGDTTVNNDGVTINNGPSMTKDGINANNTKVTNVADGVDAADAVNKGQLDKVDTKVSNVAQNVVNVLGGDATVNGNGDITMSNIGETGKGNINDAIKSVNDLAKKAAAEKTSVKAKEGRSNVTVTEGVNAAGGHEYTVDVERSVTNAGSDYVTVTNNHDADTNTTTYTVDVSAKTKASLAKADSAVQGLTSKDGNLNFTKGANGNVEVSFNDNLNVKNVTTDRVQVANGPSMSKDGINAAGKAISNVANGNVAADSKDAVNGGQLHETAKSVADVIGGGATVKDGKVVAGQNGIGNTGQNTVHGAIAAINQNTANNFNQIRGDLRKMDRDLRGGIAGALATAGLPQAFRPGKSMVAAAASTYRGQSGLAIGVSRISDNGKVILKVTGNTNSRGDFGGTIGAGYQW